MANKKNNSKKDYGLTATERATLLNETDTAKILGMSPLTLRGWRQKGIGPPFVRVAPRAIRYNLLAIMQYQDENTHQNTIYNQGY